jgi:hypothetical protein
VQRVGHELLAGPRFPPEQHGRARGCHLGHLLVDLLHGPAAAHDVADVVALGELAPELRVLVEEALPLRLHQVVDPHRLADHRAHDPEELHLLLVSAVTGVGQGRSERSHRLPLGLDGHAHVGDLVAPRALEHLGAVQEERLAAHPRHHHRTAALHDPPGDPLADPVPGARVGAAGSARGLDHEVAGLLVLEDHDPRERPVALLQHGEDALQGGAQVEGRPEGLADVEQVRQLPRIGGAGRHVRILTEMSASLQSTTELSALGRAPPPGYGWISSCTSTSKRR